MAAVTIEEFQRRNRAPVWPGKWNVWTLCRTGRDEPSDDDVKETTAAVFAKWFGTNGLSSVLDTAITYYGTSAAGSADLIKVESIVPRAGGGDATLLEVAKKADLLEEHRDAGVSLTRDSAAGPLQMIRSGGTGPMFVRVRFAWRNSKVYSVPWPVWRTGILGHATRSYALEPMAEKDWCLWRVHPFQEGVPGELSNLQKLAEQMGDAAFQATTPLANEAEAIAQSVVPVGVGVVGAGVVLGGLYLGAQAYSVKRGRG